MARPRLRIALLIDGPRMAAWLRRALEEVLAGGCAELALVLREGDLPRSSLARRLARLPFEGYRALDRRAFRAAPDAFAEVDASDLLRAPATLTVHRASTAPNQLDTESVEALRSHGLDVLLHLGSRALEGAALEATRLGVWTWSDLELERKGFAPFLAELLAGRGPFESAFVALRPGGEPPRVLYRSWAAHEPSPRPRGDALSLQRGHGPICWKNAAFAARCLQAFAGGAAGAQPSPPGSAPLRPLRPGLATAVRIGAALAPRLPWGRLVGRRHDVGWFIATRKRVEGPVGVDMRGFCEIAAPPGRFYADPFLVASGSRHYLFFEDADLALGKGAIRCAELDASGQPTESRIVLGGAEHVSYPFVFEWRGEWLMLPESSARGTLELHRAIEFPWRWELDRILLRDVQAADPTVWEQDGRLWLFLSMAPRGGSLSDELFLFFADSPRGPWTPHPGNPVVSDVRRARSAGRLFVENGALIRPAQDCSERYGGAICLQRVEKLGTTEYREAPLRRIEPDWHPESLCTHALDRAGALEAVDGLRLVRRRRGT